MSRRLLSNLRRAIVLAAILLSTPVNAEEAAPEPDNAEGAAPEPVNCVPDKRCPEGWKPGVDCCVPPPCRFYKALRLARAKADITRSLIDRFYSAESAKAAAEYAAESYKQASELLEQANPCRPEHGLEDPPMLDVDEENQCEIRYFEDFDNQIGEVSLDDYLANFRSCKEELEAKYAQAEDLRQSCLEERDREGSRSLFDKMMQDLGRDVSEELALDAELLYYKQVCSVSDEADDARQATLLGTYALKRAPPRQQPPKIENRRSGPKKPRGTT